MPETDSVPREEPSEQWLALGRKRVSSAITWRNDDWERATRNFDFYRGHHLTPNEKQRLKDDKRAAVEWNDMSVIINSMVGREVLSRYQPMFRGRITSQSEDDTPGAQALTEIERWVRGVGNVEVQEADGLLDAFITGLGATKTHAGFLEDPMGRIYRKHMQPWEYAYDHAARGRNLEDIEYWFRFRKLSLQKAKVLFPDFAKDLETKAKMDRHWIPHEVSARDGIKYAGQQGRFYDPDTESIHVVEYEYREPEASLYRVVDPSNQEILHLELDQFMQWRQAMRTRPERPFEPQEDRHFSVLEVYRYKQAVMAGDHMALREPQDASVQRWSAEFITCFPHRQPEGTRFFCPVDVGRDPQRWKDKFLMLMIDLIATSPKAPVHAEIGAFDDVDQAKKDLPRDDSIVMYARGALREKKVQFGRPPQFFSGLDSMFIFAKEAIRDAMGLSRTGSGQVDDPRRAPFATVNALQAANQSAFAMVFDSFRLYRRRTAELDIWMAAEFIPPNAIRKLLGEEKFAALPEPESPEKFGAPLKDLSRYDVVADEGATSPNQMRELFQVLTATDMMTLLATHGLMMPPEVLVKMFQDLGLPAEYAQEWLQSIAQKPQIIEEFIATLPPELQQVIQQVLQQQQGAAPPAGAPAR